MKLQNDYDKHEIYTTNTCNDSVRRADSYYIRARLLYECKLFDIGKVVPLEWLGFLREFMFEVDTHRDTDDRALHTAIGARAIICDMEGSLTEVICAAPQSALCWDALLFLSLCAQ